MRQYRWLLPLVVLVGFFAFAGVAWTEGSPQPLRVTGTSPADRAKDIPRNAAVKVTFDQELASVDKNNIFIYVDGHGGGIYFNPQIDPQDPKTIDLNNAQLPGNQVISFQIGIGSVTGKNGQGLSHDVNFSFTTRQEAGPLVAATDPTVPADKAPDVPTDTIIKIKFQQAVKINPNLYPDSNDPYYIQVCDRYFSVVTLDPKGQVNGGFSCKPSVDTSDPRLLLLTPREGRMPADATVRVTLNPDSVYEADNSSEGLEGCYSFQFDTYPDGAVNIPDQSLYNALHYILKKAPQRHIYPADMETLTTLFLNNYYGIEPIKSLVGLETATNLEHLELGGQQVTDLTPLQGLSKLKYLGLEGNGIDDQLFLALGIDRLTGLTELRLDGNYIGDLSPLARLINLETLSLDSNQLNDFDDENNPTKKCLQPLAGLTKLQYLSLVLNHIADLSPLEQLSLKHLDLWFDNVGNDLAPLTGMKGLEYLDLGFNGIDAVDNGEANQVLQPLAGLTNLYYLNLSGNYFGNIQPLADNSGLGQGDRVVLFDNYNLDTAEGTPALQVIKTLQQRGADVGYDTTEHFGGDVDLSGTAPRDREINVATDRLITVDYYQPIAYVDDQSIEVLVNGRPVEFTTSLSDDRLQLRISHDPFPKKATISVILQEGSIRFRRLPAD